MRKGVSPIIATVLLITITVSLAFIIFSSSKEFLTQLSPPPSCEGVSFVAGVYDDKNGYVIEIENNGNKAIQGFELFITDLSLGEINVIEINLPLEIGQSSFQNILFETSPKGKEMVLIPITKNANGETKTCGSQFSKAVFIK